MTTYYVFNDLFSGIIVQVYVKFLVTHGLCNVLSAYIILRQYKFLQTEFSKLLFLQVDFIVPFLDMHLSQTMYSAIVNLPRVKETNDIRNHMFDDAKTHGPKKSALNMSVSLKLAKLGLQVDLDGNYEESSGVIIDVEGIDIRLIIGYYFCNLGFWLFSVFYV